MQRDTLLISLVSLLDDPDRSVRLIAWDKLALMGEEVVGEIENLIPELSKKMDSNDLNSLLKELKVEFIMKKIESYTSNPDPLLLDGLLLVTSSFEPDLDKIKYLTIVQDIADEMLLEINDNRTAMENMEIFNHIFFRRVGFKSVDDEITIKDNAVITTVLDTKRCNLISLSMCYFTLARYTGLPIYPVIEGQSFSPAYLDHNNNPLFYVNIFKNGIIFSKDLGEPKSRSRVGKDKILVSMYADQIYYLFKKIGDSETCNVMKRVRDCFGGAWYLN